MLVFHLLEHSHSFQIDGAPFVYEVLQTLALVAQLGIFLAVCLALFLEIEHSGEHGFLVLLGCRELVA